MIDKEFEFAVIELVKSALDGKTVTAPEKFNLEKVFDFAKGQSLVPLMYYGAVNSKLNISGALDFKFNNIVLSHVLVDQQQQFELVKLQNAFEQNAIDYMPLKGVLLRHLYPKTEMRPMGDADIMIREEQRDLISQTMESLGYSYSYETDHEWVFKKGVVIIELHKCFIPPRTKDFYEYYKDSWSFAKKVEKTNCRYEMSDEDHLVYLVTHFAKHYRAGGVGVLHMADFYLFLKNKTLNNRYVREELEKLQLLKFYDNVVTTIEAWFNNGPQDTRTDFITHRVFTNGLWGTVETRDLAIASRTTRTKYKIRQVFPKIGGMKFRYPILKKHPYLLPVMWCVRWVDLLCFRREHFKRKIASFQNIQDDNVLAYQQELDYVGLSFNYKE